MVENTAGHLLTDLERILPKVVKPARYTGNEWNSIVKEWPGKLHVALAYPDVYEEGVGHPWVLRTYDILNRERDMLCERTFAPWPDMENALRAADLPLHTLESKRPLTEFDIMLIVLPGELYAPSVLTLLDLARLPLRADARRRTEVTDAQSGGRGRRVPLVVGIGPGTANPEPLADFFDAFIIGDVDADIVRQAAAIASSGEWPPTSGLYIPGLYSVSYAEDGTIASIRPEIPVVAYRHVGMPRMVTKPVVPFTETAHEWAIVELAQPPVYHWLEEPWRERPVEEILAGVEALLSSTGYDHVQLVGPHSRLAEIVDRLSSRYAGMHLHFVLEEAGTDPQIVDLADRLPRLSRGAFTFHVDTDSGDIAEAARLCFRCGWHMVKIVVHVGQPGGLSDDAIIALACQVRDIGREEVDGRAQVHIVAVPYIPRAHSRWERMGIPAGEEWDRRVEMLRKGIRGPGLRLQWYGLATRLVQAAFARGDRRLSHVIEAAWRSGMHRPGESQNEASWQAAFAEVGCDIAFYATRERPQHEILPWHHISLVE